MTSFQNQSRCFLIPYMHSTNFGNRCGMEGKELLLLYLCIGRYKPTHASFFALIGWDCQTLFPDNAYGVDSGGDPTVIPNLTFDYFKGFHERFYHPGNSRVYFYGDDPPLKVLHDSTILCVTFLFKEEKNI